MKLHSIIFLTIFSCFNCFSQRQLKLRKGVSTTYKFRVKNILIGDKKYLETELKLIN